MNDGDGDGEEKNLEELAAGGQPSGETEIDPVGDAQDVGQGGHVAAAAGLVGVDDVDPIGAVVTPDVCGQNYTDRFMVYAEKCSLPSGHKPRSSTANHYNLNIGWWA